MKSGKRKKEFLLYCRKTKYIRQKRGLRRRRSEEKFYNCKAGEDRRNFYARDDLLNLWHYILHEPSVQVVTDVSGVTNSIK